jgi:hypothetical protein
MTGTKYDPELIESRLREVRSRRVMLRRRSYSWIAWLLDTTPEQLYVTVEFPRTAVQEARRQWLRAHTSWAFLARFQTAFAVSLAAGLPSVALLIQQVPDLRGSKPAHVLGWCVLAGVLWLGVCGMYRLLAPRLMKAVIGNYAGQQGSARRQLLASLVGQEFDRLISLRPWPIPDEADLHFPENRNHRNDARAREMAIHGYFPVVVGFGPDAQARIERAIIEWAAQVGVRVVEASGRTWTILDRHRTIWEGRWPCVRHLSLRLIRKSDATPNDDVEDAPAPGDLLIEWSDAPLDILQEVLANDGALHRRNAVEGVRHILDNDTRTDIMASIVAQWTNWQRPWARFGILFLCFAVLALVGMFVALEISLVLHAMRDG